MRAYVSSPLLHRNVLIIFVDTRLELRLPGQEQEIASHSLDPIFPRATDLSPTFHHFLIRCLPTSPANHFISPLINARGRIEGNVSIIAAIDRRETRWFFLFFFFFSWRKELEARTGKVSSILRNENVDMRLRNCSIDAAMIDKTLLFLYKNTFLQLFFSLDSASYRWFTYGSKG